MISTHHPAGTTTQAAATTSKYFLNPTTKAPSPPESTLYAQQTSMPPTPPSTNTSPSDHHSHLNVRPVRQPRQPMYVPAALRPTEPPSTRPANIPNRPRAPDTPPTSKDNSFDSGKSAGQKDLDTLESSQESAATASTTLTHPSSASPPPTAKSTTTNNNPSDLHRLRQTLSRRASSSLSLPTPYPPVHADPTTAHWKPDSASPACSICRETFTFFFRRHHCRSCGDVVCEKDSRGKVPLDENARFNARGGWWRACGRCVGEWGVVEKLRKEREEGVNEEEEVEGMVVGGLEIPARPSLGGEGGGMAQSMARSQGAMEWSTF